MEQPLRTEHVFHGIVRCLEGGRWILLWRVHQIPLDTFIALFLRKSGRLKITLLRITFNRRRTEHDDLLDALELLRIQLVENMQHVVAAARKSIEPDNRVVRTKLVQGRHGWEITE